MLMTARSAQRASLCFLALLRCLLLGPGLGRGSGSMGLAKSVRVSFLFEALLNPNHGTLIR